jgi:hypothetical protein
MEDTDNRPAFALDSDQSSQVQRSRDFLTRLWHLENSERPGFIIGYTGPAMKGGTPLKSALFSTEGKDTIRDRLLDPEKYLRAQLEEIHGQLQFHGDYVPTLCPALGVVGVPSAFGCEVLWFEKDFPAAKPSPAVSPEMAKDIVLPETTSGELGRILEYTEYFIRQSSSALPIRLADIQGPLDSAALVVGHNNFLSALVTHPNEMHYLMSRVTELTIAFVKKQREVVRSHGVEFVPSMFQPWIPDGFGVSVSNDECVMISAEMHNEFHVPYLNMLSEEFGGIYVHSCGDWTHQIPSLKTVRQLRGVEFGASETNFAAVAETFAGKVVTSCRIGLHRDLKFKGIADFVRTIRSIAPTNRGLFINVDITNGIIDDGWPQTDLTEIYSLLESD